MVYGFCDAIILEGWIRQEQNSFFVSARIQISTRNPLCSNIERAGEEETAAASADTAIINEGIKLIKQLYQIQVPGY